MDAIRAKLQAQENAAQGGQQGGGSNEPQAFLAHWNIPEGVPLNLRFLPDANPNNDFFWREREMITLWFPGIKGGEMKRTKVVVPCNEMWGPVNSWSSIERSTRMVQSKRSSVGRASSPILEEEVLLVLSSNRS